MAWSIRRDVATGDDYISAHDCGDALLVDPLTNKGTAFTIEERDELGLEGLLPPVVSTIEQQLARVYETSAPSPHRWRSTSTSRACRIATRCSASG